MYLLLDICKRQHELAKSWSLNSYKFYFIMIMWFIYYVFFWNTLTGVWTFVTWLFWGFHFWSNRIYYNNTHPFNPTRELKLSFLIFHHPWPFFLLNWTKLLTCSRPFSYLENVFMMYFLQGNIKIQFPFFLSFLLKMYLYTYLTVEQHCKM